MMSIFICFLSRYLWLYINMRDIMLKIPVFGPNMDSEKAYGMSVVWIQSKGRGSKIRRGSDVPKR